MAETPTYGKVCVLIPTYNNAATLGQVLRDALSHTSDVLVVNDGATDHTAEVLGQFPEMPVLSYTPNRGKGIALRRGFEFARERGYDYAITMDADGQHFASDIAVFMEKLKADGPAIYIGARNLQQENMPGKNTFANKFSNFWFYVETGLRGPDTQSGFRLYPLHAIGNTRFFCTKYEFEIEVLVRSAWKGVRIDWVPVQVYYPPAEERVSHFRPFRDFSRISVLNTVLVTIAFAYIHPRNFIRFLFSKGGFKQLLREHLFNPDEPSHRKALSIGFGVFMGIVPIWGFQMLTAVVLAAFLRLNKALVLIASNISIPPMIPVIVYLSFLMGRMYVSEDATWILFSKDLSIASMQRNIYQYITGSLTLAVVAGAVAALTSWALLAIFRKKRIAA